MTIRQYIERRKHLEAVLLMAQSRVQTEETARVVRNIEFRISMLKMELNSTY